MYGYKCEYCDGTVRKRIIAREAFKHKTGFVILENVPIGVCDKCGSTLPVLNSDEGLTTGGNRYYSAEILHRVEGIAC